MPEKNRLRMPADVASFQREGGFDGASGGGVGMAGARALLESLTEAAAGADVVGGRSEDRPLRSVSGKSSCAGMDKPGAEPARQTAAHTRKPCRFGRDDRKTKKRPGALVVTTETFTGAMC